jgi:hypothetical protein
MKYLIIALALYVICFSATHARIVENNSEKRFLGSVTSWINNNVINPINNHVINPISSGINTVTGEIGNFFTNTIPDQFNNVVNQIKDPILNVANIIGGIFFPYQPQQPQYVDFCDLTCRSRFTIDGKETDFFFDKPNGCISKGFTGPRADVFNQCCDEHNQCLNSKCCTNNCQELKQECDTQYEACTKQVCFKFIHDNAKFMECIGDGVTISNAAKSAVCNAEHTRNRKLCYCHV